VQFLATRSDQEMEADDLGVITSTWHASEHNRVRPFSQGLSVLKFGWPNTPFIYLPLYVCGTTALVQPDIHIFELVFEWKPKPAPVYPLQNAQQEHRKYWICQPCSEKE